MDYFLEIYDIYDWSDYIIKTFDIINNDNVNTMIISILFKRHPKEIIIDEAILILMKQIFVKIGECKNDVKEDELIKLIYKYVKIYSENNNEPLFIDKIYKKN